MPPRKVRGVGVSNWDHQGQIWNCSAWTLSDVWHGAVESLLCRFDWHIHGPYNQMSSTHNERQGDCSSDGMWDNSKNGTGKSIMLLAAADR
jgi:hypothetical protein